jgi:Uma2 family endonuclease
MSIATPKPIASQSGPQPAWDIAKLFPYQGHWSVSDYLQLNGNYFVEFTDGNVEVLPMPTLIHQLIVKRLFVLLEAFVIARNLGLVVFAPFRIRLDEMKFREPDLMFMSRENFPHVKNEFSDGADLVMEVVSDDDRKRDLEIKRREYAQAGVPEYWIVDPQNSQITVLKLAANQYAIHGTFTAGQSASSALLAGFAVPVADVFAAQ